MRRALVNYKPITTVHGQPGFGYFGKHAGYDYGVVKQPVVAPEGGVITNTKIAPTADGGSIVELCSNKYDHRFLHLDSIAVKKGQTVREGQKLGVSGNTGNVGYHLHHDTRKKGTVWTHSFSDYVDWEKLIAKEQPQVMKTNRTEAILLYRSLLGIHSPTEAQKKSWTGRDLGELLTAIMKDKRYLDRQKGDPTSNDEAVKKSVIASIINKIKGV